MNSLLGATPTLVMAAVLLTVVGSLPSLGGARARLAALVYVAAVGLGAAVVWRFVNGNGVLFDIQPSRVLRYAARELNAAKAKNVLLIEGGSYVLNGVDASTLADELHSLGYSVDVVRLAVSAANHFERYRMQQQLVERLTAKPPSGQHWVYLAETQLDYDRLPLAQFDHNQDSIRAYHYLTLSNSWQAARALTSPGIEGPSGGAWRWPLFRHALINSFSAGALVPLTPEGEIESAGGNVNPRRASRFRFPGLSPLIATPKQPHRGPVPYPWIREIREPRLRHLWRHYVDTFAYFGLPSTTADQLEYVRDFCGAIKTPCIAPTDDQLLEALDARDKWRDSGHLSLKGAKIYSPWLAHEVARLGLLEK